MCEDAGRFRQMLHHAQLALALAEGSGDRRVEARALGAVSWSLAHIGRLRQALGYGKRALAVLQELDDVAGLANAWDTLGFIFHWDGDHQRAVTCYQLARDQYDREEDRHGRAETLHHLGDAYLAMGDADAARAAWHRAIAILQELADPEVDEIREKVARPERAATWLADRDEALR